MFAIVSSIRICCWLFVSLLSQHCFRQPPSSCCGGEHTTHTQGGFKARCARSTINENERQPSSWYLRFFGPQTQSMTRAQQLTKMCARHPPGSGPQKPKIPGGWRARKTINATERLPTSCSVLHASF